MAGEQPKVYMSEGGDKITIASGGSLVLESGGTLTIADGALEVPDIALAQGSVLVGDSDGEASALAAGGDTKILVGNGTTITSVALSGDVTMANTGAVTIAEGAVEDSMIEGLSAGQFILGVDGTAANNTKATMSGPFSMDATGKVAVDTATVAADGSNQSEATAIADGFTLVTAANAAKGVKLPAAAAGTLCFIKNEDSANAVLKVYPNTDDAINAIAANTEIDMAAKTSAVFIAYDVTTWYTIPLLPS